MEKPEPTSWPTLYTLGAQLFEHQWRKNYPFSTELPLLLHQKSDCIKVDVYEDPSLKVSQPARLFSTYQRNVRNDRCVLICFYLAS